MIIIDTGKTNERVNNSVVMFGNCIYDLFLNIATLACVGLTTGACLVFLMRGTM